MNIIILLINLLILSLVGLMVWWRWKERSLNKRLEEVILTVPRIEEVPLKVREIQGEVIPGRVIEYESGEREEESVEEREWREEQNWLNRRKQAES